MAQLYVRSEHFLLPMDTVAQKKNCLPKKYCVLLGKCIFIHITTYEEKCEIVGLTNVLHFIICFLPVVYSLGLGAKFVAHKPPAETEAERRLRNSLRKQREHEAYREDSKSKVDSDASADEMESRTASVKRRVRRKRKSSNSSNPISIPKEKIEMGKEKQIVNVKKHEMQKDEKNIIIKKSEQSAVVPINFRMTDFGTRKDGSEKGSRNAAKSDDHVPKKGPDNIQMSNRKPKPYELNQRKYDGILKQGKKKSKKRSRQKNLRRDKRAKSELPTDLTEETLQTGRVYRDEKGALLTV